jgi:hypothetical protein
MLCKFRIYSQITANEAYRPLQTATGNDGFQAGTNPPEQPPIWRLGKMANSVFGTARVPVCSDSEETPAAQSEHVFRRAVPEHAQREEVRAGTEQRPPLEGACCSDPLTPRDRSLVQRLLEAVLARIYSGGGDTAKEPREDVLLRKWAITL